MGYLLAADSLVFAGSKFGFGAGACASTAFHQASSFARSSDALAVFAVAREPVDLRRLVKFAARARDIREAHVVDEDENEIQPLGGAHGRKRSEEKEKKDALH